MFEINQFHHVSVLVSNLEKSRQFYEGILGLKVANNRPEMTFDGIWYQIGSQQIHLLVLPAPDEGIERPEHGGRDYHFALSVTHFDELVAQLESHNIPYSRSKSGRAALFCRDPDDNAVELIGV